MAEDGGITASEEEIREIKVITQEALDNGEVRFPRDKLDHRKVANQIADIVRIMEPGSVIAIQASWGRGKTDILGRVALTTYENHQVGDCIAPRALWINPWQHGSPDLLTPLAFTLVKRLIEKAAKAIDNAEENWFSAGEWRAIGGVIAAGAAFGLKALGTVAPAGNLFEMVSPVIEKGLTTLFASKAERVKSESERFEKKKEQALAEFGFGVNDEDPVAKMSSNFTKLINALTTEKQRILICIDDLDRCLPGRQVAMLEAIHFLTGTNARAIFLVAIDPILAQQAVLTHYRSDNFDPRLYLDKIFSYRHNLTAIVGQSVQNLMSGHLNRKLSNDCGKLGAGVTLGNFVQQSGIFDEFKIENEDTEALKKVLKARGSYNEIVMDQNEAQKHFGEALYALADEALIVQELRNPRIVRRLANRLFLLAHFYSKDVHALPGKISLKTFLLWLAVCERWPEVRFAVQDVKNESDFGNRMKEIRKFYETEKPENLVLDNALIRSLPPRKSNPGMVEFFTSRDTLDRAQGFCMAENLMTKIGI